VRFAGTTVSGGLDEVRAHFGSDATASAAIAVYTPDAGDVLERAARETAVLAALGAGAGRLEEVAVPTVDSDCPMVLLVVATPPTSPVQPAARQAGHEIWAVKAMSSAWHDDIAPRLADGVLDGARLAQLEVDHVAVRLGFMVFKPHTAELGGPSTTRQLADEPQFAGDAMGTVSVFSAAAFTDDRAILPRQAVAAATAVGAPIAVAGAQVVEVAEPPLAAREVLTVVLIRRD
jgi:hypothetical protein